jgi:hypothetical protein
MYSLILSHLRVAHLSEMINRSSFNINYLTFIESRLDLQATVGFLEQQPVAGTCSIVSAFWLGCGLSGCWVSYPLVLSSLYHPLAGQLIAETIRLVQYISQVYSMYTRPARCLTTRVFKNHRHGRKILYCLEYRGACCFPRSFCQWKLS